MCSCKLHYIPERLHLNDKPILDTFQIGDLIFRRCKPEDLDNPFGKISLREISNNIGTYQGVEISLKEDVLYNIEPENNNQHYEGQIPCILEIKELNGNQYHKIYNEDINICVLRLLHDPLPCMYAHCNFSIWINEDKVTKDNYDATLNTNRNKRFRTKIRQDLALMVRRKEIRINFD